MPKTKLGSETKNYGMKKVKTVAHGEINSVLKDSEIIEFVKECFLSDSKTKEIKERLEILY